MESFAQAAGLFADLFNNRLIAEEAGELIGIPEEIARMDGPVRDGGRGYRCPQAASRPRRCEIDVGGQPLKSAGRP